MGSAVPVLGGLTWLPASVMATVADPHCEPYTDGLLGQPSNTVTSLAFVVAGVAVAAGRRGARPARTWYATLVVAVGVGSMVQHGPNPIGADLVHDLPLIALLAYVAVDAASDALGRRLSHVWWVVPSLALSPLVVIAPRAGDLAQVALAVVAVGLFLRRLLMHPAWRPTILASMGLLAIGGTIGTLSRGGWPLCAAIAPFDGHAVWHVLAAAALWWLAPVVGRQGAVEPTRGRSHVGS